MTVPVTGPPTALPEQVAHYLRNRFTRSDRRIGGRYMGSDRAEAYGRRNAVPPEMVVRVIPDRVTANVDVAKFD